MSFIDNCRKLIGIDSSPSHGSREVALFVGELCKNAGLHVEYQTENLNGLEQYNIVARPSADLPQEEVLFQTHLDTVEPGNYSGWTMTQSNPFNASIIDRRLYGLGAADTKLDFLCKLEALKEYAKRPLKTPFVLVGTFGAQTGMTGALKLVRKKMIRARKALIGEPTNLCIKNEGQGLAVVEVRIPFSQEERDYRIEHDLLESSSTQSKIFSGKAAHSSQPQWGENAIVKMLDYLAQLPSAIAIMDLDGGVNYNSVPSSAVLEIDFVGKFKDPIVPRLAGVLQTAREVEAEFASYSQRVGRSPAPNMNIGLIRTFEDHVQILGSCRLPPYISEQVSMQWIDKLKSGCEEQGATFCVRDYKRSFTLASETDLVRALIDNSRAIGLDCSLGLVESATEASVFSRLGIECIVFGPGQGVGNSHAPNECIEIEALEKATAFYKKAVERLCL